MYATAVLQGCLASTPQAANMANNPAALATFLQNVQVITAAALALRDKVGQTSGQGGGS